MKIVYCVAQYMLPFGGLRVLVEQANGLQVRGHQVEIWSLDPRIIPDIFPSKVRVVPISTDYDSESQRIVKIYSTSTEFSGIDIFMMSGYQVAPPIGAFPDAKVFWYHQHDELLLGFSESAKGTFYDLMSRPIRLLANSKWTQSLLKEKYHRDSTLVRYGLDHAIFFPSQTPLYHFSDPSLLFFYNDVEWKGSADLLSALNIVFEQIPRLRVIAVSAMVPKQFFAARDLIIHLQPKQEELRHIFASATVAVSPSWFEGFGLPGLEAMACGTPLVTTDSGGVRDYAVHEENCLMVPPKNPEALAGAILRLLNDESLRKKLVQGGLKKANEFNWDEQITFLEKVFKES